MKKNKIIPYFQLNLYRLRHRINTNHDGIDEITLIIFNNIINSFPDNNWIDIKDFYFQSMELRDNKWIVIYTIVAYKMGHNFTNAHPLFIESLIDNLITHKISPFKIVCYTSFFLRPSVLKLITTALETKGIPPKYIINLVFESFDLSNIPYRSQDKIIDAIKEFVEDFSFQIFNGNYSFFNIYSCLKKIWDDYLILELDNLRFGDIELLLNFNELPSDELKEKVMKEFERIEKKDATISEKYADCLTIITRYSYELPKYIPKLNQKQ